ncbi:tRNA pseudouridine synthase Pus10 [Natronomonas pharaonis DSM 2160]|uniref:tRNA pseudouridine synthase Pus10 n=1 Tax=Natronomonas pharaonis (strain ATCC 35678 / DSM 2160 / CIP 103997 / JCM 8858 / NBRC 14720 / NCIMB 2260 / Gabara) TaxID=348780 RepID=Q3IRF7_NATPD|nr:tRNA pseudouridine(54/55) synthase Pus10 [Natronomonas pharaonis]CAI49286.1 tRNA pseudouridine synthase Pus10 [Natronomonas pharaonis DSM 2160]
MTVLDAARDALDSGPVCNACLGRLFADRSFGLTNEARGRSLRTTIALEDDEPYEEPEADCWVCEGICDRFEEFADRVVDALGETELYTYQVGTRVPPLVAENDRLLRAEAGLAEDAGEPLKTELNREVGRRVGARLDADVDFERPDVQFLLDLDADTVEVQRNSLAIYGRYRKLERDIPQTEWDRYDESVAELISPPFLSAFRGTEAVFHGAGREDVDALMLGTGRPFVLEIKQPRRRQADLEALREEAHDHADGKVEIENLTAVTYEMVERVKEHDGDKTYRATVEFGAAVDESDFEAALAELDGTTIEQRTPHRVDHRRADLVRERTVLDIDGELEADHAATVEVHGEGGLYIKELMSGDEGRTEPSLAGLLGVGATVTALDVLAVEGVDEPFLTDDYRLERDGEPVSGA